MSFTSRFPFDALTKKPNLKPVTVQFSIVTEETLSSRIPAKAKPDTVWPAQSRVTPDAAI